MALARGSRLDVDVKASTSVWGQGPGAVLLSILVQLQETGGLSVIWMVDCRTHSHNEALVYAPEPDFQ